MACPLSRDCFSFKILLQATLLSALLYAAPSWAQIDPSEGDDDVTSDSPALPAQMPEKSQKSSSAPFKKPAPAAPTNPKKPAASSNTDAVDDPAVIAATQPPPPEKHLYNTARLQGLNKTTARVTEILAPVGTVARFGNLEILARSCWKSASDERDENAALLEVWELKPKEQPAQIFSGWMFASSPALSALEHPVYDITVQGCEDSELKE